MFVRRECLYYLNEFLSFVLNKFIEEYFGFFSFGFAFCVVEGTKEKWSITYCIEKCKVGFSVWKKIEIFLEKILTIL